MMSHTIHTDTTHHQDMQNNGKNTIATKKREAHASRQASPSEDRKMRPYFAVGEGIPDVSRNTLEMPSLTRSVFSSTMPLREQTDILSSSSKPVFRSLPDFARSASDDMFSSYINDVIVTPRPLPEVFEETTSFECDRPATEIYWALEAALSQYDTEAKPAKGKFKGRGVILGEEVCFQVHIFAKPQYKGHVVEFQRRSGDSCSFWHMFANVMNALSVDLADAAAFVKKNLESPTPVSTGLWSAESSLDELAKSLALTMVKDRKDESNFKTTIVSH
uniref:KA1 domain-containing protein n=1 Tax=Lotharella globosa TaxID=91324 RepID=A0A7S3ZFT8_9EUKA|mmetsp:Transcript_20488/g.41300  ORF Transcript_20488/g.41300 Transcript_20488/m.41300 type:complete len:276 (+) Transcript_20488:22-849(+)